MSTLPASPRVRKGALVTLDANGDPQTVIAFQYNPETLNRTLKAQSVGGEHGQPLHLFGPPIETISFTAEIDATDQLADAQDLALQYGIHPTLAALELLLYPESEQVLRDGTLADQGFIGTLPPEAPLTLLVWGQVRVVPVRLDELTITEEQFDERLNPIHAKVQMSLRVLTYLDLGLDSQGGSRFMAHQLTKESLASAYSNSNSAETNNILSVLFPDSGTGSSIP